MEQMSPNLVRSLSLSVELSLSAFSTVLMERSIQNSLSNGTWGTLDTIAIEKTLNRILLLTPKPSPPALTHAHTLLTCVGWSSLAHSTEERLQMFLNHFHQDHWPDQVYVTILDFMIWWDQLYGIYFICGFPEMLAVLFLKLASIFFI